MKHKLMSLGLGIALSLGILLFMATLVEPPGGEGDYRAEIHRHQHAERGDRGTGA
jgi:hypothetical protein